MPHILLTGKNSFIGKNFIASSVYREVTAVSLREKDPVDIDFSGIGVVIHLAALVHQSRRLPEDDYFRINRDLTLKLARVAKERGVRHFVFLSTVKTYGPWKGGTMPWTETSPCFPDDPYGMSKYQAECGLKELADDNFIVSIIRTPIVYGPGVAANMMKLIRLIDRFPILPFRDIDNNRHYTSVINLVAYIDRIIQLKASGTFLVMDDESMSTTRLVMLLAGFLGRKRIMFKLPDFIVRAGVFLMPEVFDKVYKSFYLDNSLTKSVLQFKTVCTLHEGLEQLILSYKKVKGVKTND